MLKSRPPPDVEPNSIVGGDSKSGPSSRQGAITLGMVLRKQGVIQNYLHENASIRKIRDSMAIKSRFSASLFIELERYVKSKIRRGDRYLLRDELTMLFTEQIPTGLSPEDIENIFSQAISDKPGAIYADEFLNAVIGIMDRLDAMLAFAYT